MNTLSWLIYLAEVTQTLGMWCAVIGVFTLCFSIALAIVVLTADTDYGKGKAFYPTGVWLLRRSIIVGSLLILLSVFLPSQQTMILIAGSEVGETIAKSPQAKAGMDLIETWIKSETARLNKPNH